MLEPLEDCQWRTFRMFMRELDDAELERLDQHLQREMRHRQECESSVAQLFFSSLSALDLQRADAEIRHQRSDRLEILMRFQSQSQSQRSSARKKLRRTPKRQRA